jgi:hypothetical protein
MADRSPLDWIEEKREEFASFDLSALNAAGWLLFLSAFVFIFVGIFLQVTYLQPVLDGLADQRGKKVLAVIAALANILLAVGWFQLGKHGLKRMGISIYRAAYQEGPERDLPRPQRKYAEVASPQREGQRNITADTEGEPPQEIAYGLDVHDAVAFWQYHLDHPPVAPALRPALRWTWLGLLLLFGLIALAANVKRLVDERLPGGGSAVGTIAGAGTFLGLLALALLGFAYRRRIRGLIWRWRLRGQVHQLSRPTRLSVTPQELSRSFEGATTTTPWTQVSKVAATESHAFVYLTPEEAVIIPRRAFDDARAFERFVERIRNYHEATSAPPRLTPGPGSNRLRGSP